MASVARCCSAGRQRVQIREPRLSFPQRRMDAAALDRGVRTRLSGQVELNVGSTRRLEEMGFSEDRVRVVENVGRQALQIVRLHLERIAISGEECLLLRERSLVVIRSEHPEAVSGVWKKCSIGWDPSSRERFAILEYHGHIWGISSETIEANFRRECDTYAMLREHRIRNIPQWLGYVQTREAQGRSWMAMILEYLPGGDLLNWLNRIRNEDGVLTPPSVNIVLKISISILQALADLHSHGLVHRDLKLENMLLAEDGTARLIDFDVLADITRLREIVMDAGTHEYLAPELRAVILRPSFERVEVLDLMAADIWALGICLARLLANNDADLDVAEMSIRIADVIVRRQCLAAQLHEHWQPRLRRRLIEGGLRPSVNPIVASMHQLVFELLSVDPNERPTASQALARLEEIRDIRSD